MQRQILMRSFLVALAALLALALPASTVEPSEIDTDPPLVDTLMSDGMTREEMVGLYEALAVGGSEPPDCVAGEEMFDDVPASSIFCPWIEELARRGITGGCDADSYCPGDPVSRAQMAAFIVRAIEAAAPRWAVITDGGSVDRGRGVVDAEELGTGSYRVTFEQGVGSDTCAGTVTVGRTNQCLNCFGYLRGGGPDWFVEIRNSSGEPESRPFQIQVTC